MKASSPQPGRIPSDKVFEAVGRELDGTERPLLIYVHLPFCASKCTFCDWVNEIDTPTLRSGYEARKAYISALTSQIRRMGPALAALGYRPGLIYWGGGTPTRLEPVEIIEVFQALSEALDLSEVEEFTVECSPDTVDSERLEALRGIGASRMSMGAQSFDDAELRRVGRVHSSKQIDIAAALVQRTGFTDLNIDLILGLPGHTLASAMRSLDRLLEIGPSHVTLYIYRATGNTTLARQLQSGLIKTPEYEEVFEMYRQAKSLLIAAGYSEYAIGYFRKTESSTCKADIYYFSLQGDYFGFGSGAHSILGHHFLSNLPTNRQGYLSDPVGFDVCKQFSLQDPSLLFSSVRQAMWVPEGLNYERFHRLYGLPFSELRQHQIVSAFMDYYEYCGARFEADSSGLRVSLETLASSYIKALSFYGVQGVARSAGKKPESFHE